MSETFTFQTIAHIETPFADKFGIPRQPSLAPHAIGQVRLLAPYNRPEAVRGLEDFSHIWLSFIFHHTLGEWHPTVRPPRLGGNQRVGVFASRSPFRPNSLGLSLVELEHIDTHDGVVLHVKGVDLLNGTPIVDIKPYIPFAESQPVARGGFVDGAPAQLQVVFSALADHQCAAQSVRYPHLAALIQEVLAQDPRPAYANDADRVYGVRLYQFDVKWCCDGDTATVVALESLE